jgi:thiol peroxidase
MSTTMSERANAVTLKGNPMTLVGQELKVGDQAPDATLVASDLSEVKISSFKGKKLVISAMPSIDTPVCDLEGKRFNKEAINLKDVTVINVTVDLPFAQKRWCGALESNNMTTLSDYRYGSFGENYGVMIKGLKLLARCVFVIDTDLKIRYIQLVKEVSQEPDYAAVLNAVKSL